MNCGLYVRVSTNKQETSNQLGQLGDFARKQGWTIVIEYVDEVTGKHADRAAFSGCFAMPASAVSTCSCFGASTG